MITAITRAISPAIANCELTHLSRQSIDLEHAEHQHAEYEAALTGLGCTLQRLPAAPDLPDSVFVEDCAIVLDEVAVLTRPGAASRRAEVSAIEAALAPHRPLLRIEAPHTLDGGDVLRIDRTLHVGLSRRSSPAAIEQLGEVLAPLGYAVRGVPITGCLHLKSAVCRIGDHQLLLNPDWVDPSHFPGQEPFAVDPAEPFAANVLRIGETLIAPAAHARTRRQLEAAGFRLRGVDVSELAKAEGGVTCCSLIVTD